MRILTLVLVLATLCGSAAAQNRFKDVSPLPGIRWAKVDTQFTAGSIANQLAREKRAQARVLWLDGTANMASVANEEAVRRLMAKIAKAGFNTIVFDVKPIVGRVMYPSRIAPRLTSWRGQSISADFDPLAAVVRFGKLSGLSVLVSLNAFSEGHLFAKRDAANTASDMGEPGWGYTRPDLQAVQYVATPALSGPSLPSPFPVAAEFNPQTLEADRAIEERPKIGVYGRIPSGVKLPCVSVILDGEGRAKGNLLGLPTELGEYDTLLVGVGPGADMLAKTLPGDRMRIVSQGRFARSADVQTQIPLMMNISSPEVQSRALALLREVATNYNVDGILYDDRMRFAAFDADFSPESRAGFAKHIGREPRWPDDVFRHTYGIRLQSGVRPGPLYDDWLAYRARILKRWVQSARKTVTEARPGTLFGIYAGSTYADYPKFGSNYGAPDLVAGYPFMSREYRREGFGLDLDLIMTGCYYRVGTVFEAMENGISAGHSVEAAAAISNRAIDDSTWVYAGIQLSLFWADPSRLETALQAAVTMTQGVMVFDHSHQIDRFWPIFERAFSSPRRAPHQIPGLLDALRKRRRIASNKGSLAPPFPIYEGAAGAGF